MQLMELVLYSHDGERRVLPFVQGEVNIITGGSTTGKSQIINIIDYCFGSSKCKVAKGPIRDTVEWYGVRIALVDGQQMFIARRNPPRNQDSTSEAFILEPSSEVISPDHIEKPNTTRGAITEFLAEVVGIEPYQHTPPIGQTRDPLFATFRHTLAYCFQKQGEIASEKTLFHNQDDHWVAQAIKDLLPFFLGTIKTNRLELEQKLKILRRRYRQYYRDLAELEQIKGEGLGKALKLFEEARSVDVLPGGQNPADVDAIRKELEKVLDWSPQEIRFSGDDRLTQLQREYQSLNEQLEVVQQEIQAVRSWVGSFDGYTSELHEQELRLQSIGLFKVAKEVKCPLCSAHTESDDTLAKLIHGALEKVGSQLDSVAKRRPKLQEYIDEKEQQKRNHLGSGLD